MSTGRRGGDCTPGERTRAGPSPLDDGTTLASKCKTAELHLPRRTTNGTQCMGIRRGAYWAPGLRALCRTTMLTRKSCWRCSTVALRRSLLKFMEGHHLVSEHSISPCMRRVHFQCRTHGESTTNAPDALRAAYRRLIQRAPLPVKEEVRASDKQALDALVFDMLGLNDDERKEVISSLVAKTAGRLEKARSVEGHSGHDVHSVSDEDVLEYGVSDALAEVGVRRFPRDFPMGVMREMSLPETHSADGPPRVEAMMGEGVLVWPDGSHVEFEYIESAQLVALLLSLGWSGPVRVPCKRGDADRLFTELDRYVSLCRTRFNESVRDVAESEAQIKRVRQLLRVKLGEIMFNGVGEASVH